MTGSVEQSLAAQTIEKIKAANNQDKKALQLAIHEAVATLFQELEKQDGHFVYRVVFTWLYRDEKRTNEIVVETRETQLEKTREIDGLFLELLKLNESEADTEPLSPEDMLFAQLLLSHSKVESLEIEIQKRSSINY